MNKMIEKYKNLPVQVRASMWFLLCSFMQKGISLITTPIFTRILTTEEYGLYGVFNSWYGIVAIIVSMMLYQGVYAQGVVKFKDERAVFSSSLQGLTLILVAFWTLVYLLTHNFWNNLFHLTTVQMLAMLVMIWTTAVFNFWATEQRVTFRYRELVIITVATSILKPVLGIILVLNSNDKVTARIFGLVLIELIAYTGLFVIQMKRGKTFFSAKFWKYALAFNIPLIPHYLSTTVLSSSDRIMIEKYVGESESGIYNLAYSIAQIMLLFNSALMQTLNPWIYSKIRDKRTEDIKGIAYTTLTMIGVINLFLIAFAPEAVSIFAPAEYYEAIWVIPPVAMSVFFMYLYDLFAKFAFYYERTKLIAMATVCGAVVNLVTNYIFINKYGYMAAGYTTLGCYMLFAIFHYCCMRFICKTYLDNTKVYDLKVILIMGLFFLAAGFGLMATYNYRIIRYSIVVVMLVVVFIKRNWIIAQIKNIMSIRNQKKTGES